MFAYAAKHHGFCSHDRRHPNPADAVERQRERAPEIRFLSLDQIDEQLGILEPHPGIHALTVPARAHGHRPKMSRGCRIIRVGMVLNRCVTAACRCSGV